MKLKTIHYGLLLFLFLFNASIVSAFDVAGVEIHGFISQGYLKSDDNNYLANTEDGTCEFTEVGINFSKEFDKVRIGLQLLSRDLGDFGNNDIKLDWAIGDYRFNDLLGIRIGKVKMPMGLYNQERDLDMLRTSVFLPSAIYDEGTRDFNDTFQGAEIYGDLDARALGSFEYELFYGTTNVDEESVYARNIKDGMQNDIPGSTMGSDFSIEADYVAGAALRWALPIDGLRVSGTYRTAEAEITSSIDASYLPDGTGSFRSEVKEATVWVASIEYSWMDLTLTAEYAEDKIELASGIAGMGAPSEATLHSAGWYVQASWRFTDWFAASLAYAEFYPDKDDKDGDTQIAAGNPDYYAWKKEIVSSLRFDVGYNFIIKAETHFVNGAAQTYNFNNPSGRDKDWILYVLKASFNF